MRLAGHFGGACANCKWRDHAARCSVRDSQDDNDRPGRDLEAGPAGNGGGRHVQALPAAGDSADNPIELPEEEGTEDDPIEL
jgi:Protein of unknown function (DUF3716)